MAKRSVSIQSSLGVNLTGANIGLLGLEDKTTIRCAVGIFATSVSTTNISTVSVTYDESDKTYRVGQDPVTISFSGPILQFQRKDTTTLRVSNTDFSNTLTNVFVKIYTL